jgi:DNA-binding beta-propeller fold protein YncE
VFNTFNPTLLDPLTEFKTRYTTGAVPHSNFDGDGNAIVGGFIYRGSAIPQLTGMYILGSYQFVQPDGATPPNAVSQGGRLFYFDPNGTTVDASGMKLLYEFNYAAVFGITPNGNGDIYGFGQDPTGELYVLFGNGDVKEISAVPESASFVLLALGWTLLMGWRRRRNR